MKILLATDDAVSRRLLERTLERSGFEVECVSDGCSAAKVLRERDGPRIAILDWMMPCLDGLSVCREVRACADVPYVYMILLTSRGSTEDIVAGFEAGVDDYLTKPWNPGELKARLRVGQRALEMQSSLLHEAQHDPLTGLPNRSFFVKRLALCTEKAREQPGYQFTLLFVDIDRFKMINDSLGHLAGDELMRGVAERLLEVVRHEMTLDEGVDRRRAEGAIHDVVARIGGDEFVVLLDNHASVSDGVRVAERIKTVLQQPFDIHDHHVFISASIGISASDGGTRESSEIMRGADAAMYKAKSLGKARYEVDHTKGSPTAVGQLRLECDLRRALEREELEIHYQPIVNLSDRRIVGMESLLRWRHPGLGLIPPNSFIPLAEETGLIVPIGEWVLRESCRQMRRWNAHMDPAHQMAVCVNISPRQFDEGMLVQRVKDALFDADLDPRFLELEVTENLTMQEAARATHVLEGLDQLGVSLSLDDFGTGYSSLSYLRRLPIETLKIDRSFVNEISQSKESCSIVQTIVDMGHNLGMRVIAEGVETETQLAFLRKAGADYGQGYLFSKPQPAAEMEKLITFARPCNMTGHGPGVGIANTTALQWTY